MRKMELMCKTNHLLTVVVVIGTFISLNAEGIYRTPEQSPVLATVVDSLHIEKGTMEDALRSLRQKDIAKILIAFEKVARREGDPKESLSLSISNATVGEILDRLCQQSRLYRYEIVDSVIIYMHPTRVESDPPHLLDIKIKDFSLEGKMLPPQQFNASESWRRNWPRTSQRSDATITPPAELCPVLQVQRLAGIWIRT